MRIKVPRLGSRNRPPPPPISWFPRRIVPNMPARPCPPIGTPWAWRDSDALAASDDHRRAHIRLVGVEEPLS